MSEASKRGKPIPGHIGELVIVVNNWDATRLGNLMWSCVNVFQN